MELVHSARISEIERSWPFQDKDERKARLRTIIALSVELDKIKAVSTFSTLLGAGAIEDVIEGDWKSVSMWASFFTFEQEGPEYVQNYGPLWQGFVAILRGAAVEAAQRKAGVVSAGPN